MITMKAKVSRRTDKKCFEEVCFRQLVDVGGDVDLATRDRNGSSKAEKSVQVEGRDLGVVTLEVGEVEVIGKSLLQRKVEHYPICEWFNITILQ